MTIETTSAGHGIAKTAQTATGGKGKGAPGMAGDALGFFAMLSAADDALAVSADASGLLDDGSGRLPEPGTQDEKELTFAADAATLAGWVLGMPVTAAQGAPVSEEGSPSQQGNAFFTMKRSSWSGQGAEGTQTTGLLAMHKGAKPVSTTDLQKAQAVPLPGSQSVSEAVPNTKVDTELLISQEQTSTVGMEGRTLVAPASGQLPVAERRLWEPLAMKPAPADGVYFQPQSVSAPMGMDGVVASQASGAVESYVAEQVTYWIAQDVQSAELTLDGMGASPVEVSISMQGNEAQVAFRTDELHARDAIERAAEQLKDSLQRQGVLLTGMSVGTSHSGDASGQGGRSRQEGRQASVTVPVESLADSPVRPKIPQGRALDLFV